MNGSYSVVRRLVDHAFSHLYLGRSVTKGLFVFSIRISYQFTCGVVYFFLAFHLLCCMDWWTGFPGFQAVWRGKPQRANPDQSELSLRRKVKPKSRQMAV